MKERRGAVYARLRAAALAACCTVACAGGVAQAAGDDGTTTVGGHVYRLPDGAFADGVVEHGRRQGTLLRFGLPRPAGLPSAVADEGNVLVLIVAGQNGSPLSREALASDILQESETEASLDPARHRDPLRPGAPSASTPQGFVRVGTDKVDSIGDDVFVSPDLASPSELIHCGRRDPARAINFPECTDVFTWRDSVLRVTFSRDRLRDWTRVKAAVTSFFASHEVT